MKQKTGNCSCILQDYWGICLHMFNTRLQNSKQNFIELQSHNIIQLTWFGGFSSITVVKKCCPLLQVKVLCNVPTDLDVAMTAVNDPLSISDLKIC